jgi:GNAT superfamily N-acetyltransferase
MVIRPATDADVPRIVEMAERFYPESPYPAIYGDMGPNQAAGLALVAMRGHEQHIEPGVLLVAEEGDELVGMVCLAKDRATFNPAVTIASELVFWIEPEHRGGMAAVRLLKAAEDAARERGIEVNRMAVLSSSPPQAAALYERMGYALTESYYSKRLR